MRIGRTRQGYYCGAFREKESYETSSSEVSLSFLEGGGVEEANDSSVLPYFDFSFLSVEVSIGGLKKASKSRSCSIHSKVSFQAFI